MGCPRKSLIGATTWAPTTRGAGQNANTRLCLCASVQYEFLVLRRLNLNRGCVCDLCCMNMKPAFDLALFEGRARAFHVDKLIGKIACCYLLEPVASGSVERIPGGVVNQNINSVFRS